MGEKIFDVEFNSDRSDKIHPVGLAVLLLCAFGCCSCCWKRCCRKRDQHAAGNGIANAAVVTRIKVDGQNNEEVSVEDLRRRKSWVIAYALWCVGGLFGAHLFYLDRLVHGVLAATSWNFVSIGWALDVVLIPRYVYRANSRCSDLAGDDLSCRGCCCFICKAMMVGMLAFGFIGFAFARGPLILDQTGLVDIEMERSGLPRNPYDILEVPRGTSFADVSASYNSRSPATQKSECRGDKDCEAATKDKAKAFTYLKEKEAKKTVAPRPEARRRRSTSKSKVKAKSRNDDSAWIDEAAEQWHSVCRHLVNKAKSLVPKAGEEAEAEGRPGRDDSEL